MPLSAIYGVHVDTTMTFDTHRRAEADDAISDTSVIRCVREHPLPASWKDLCSGCLNPTRLHGGPVRRLAHIHRLDGRGG
jgi:hypothetical protein